MHDLISLVTGADGKFVAAFWSSPSLFLISRFVLIALNIRQVEFRAIFKQHQILFSALRQDQQPESLTSYRDVSCCSFSPWISVIWRGNVENRLFPSYLQQFLLSEKHYHICSVSLTPPTPHILLFLHWKPQKFLFFLSGYVSNTFDHSRGFSLSCLQVVSLRFVAQSWTQCFISTSASFVPSTLQHLCLFISFLRTSAQEIVHYSSLCLAVELCIFVIWLHPFSLQPYPFLTRSLCILIISSDRLKGFLSFTAPSYLWAILSMPSPKPFLKNIG